MAKSTKLFLGLVGLPGSGKTTACDHLETLGFTRISLSSFIRTQLELKKKSPTRKNLQDIGNSMRKKHGPTVLGKLAAQSINRRKLTKVVVDGIRNLGEIEELKQKLAPFYLIGIKANPRTRFPRLKSNPKNKHIADWKDFKYYEQRENKSFRGQYGLQVNTCLKEADFTISNDSSLTNFYSTINDTLKNIKKL